MISRLTVVVSCCLQLLVRAPVVNAQAAEPTTSQLVQVDGRIMSRGGSPVSTTVHFARVAANGRDVESPGKTFNTGSDGAFTFFGAHVTTYRISDECGSHADVVTGPPGSSLKAGDLIVDRTPIRGGIPIPAWIESAPALKPELILIEPRKAAGALGSTLGLSRAELFPSRPKPTNGPLCWTGLPRDWRGVLEQSNPWVTFERGITVGTFLSVGYSGARVKVVRVVDHDPTLTPAQIREEIQKVWLSYLSEASVGIMWSEGSHWNIRAIVEYEDGKQGSLLMDAWIHARLQDLEGNFWFVRIYILPGSAG